MHRVLSKFIVIFFVALAAACASVPTARVQPYAAEIAEVAATASPEERLRRDVAWLADDARQGREAGTDAYREAAKYVAGRMQSIGLKPGANGGWFQEVPLRSGRPLLETAKMSITTPDGVVHELTHLADFRVYPSIDHQTFSTTDAEMVFAGYGVSAPAFGWDDYAGLDVKGKFVVILSGAPDIFDNESRAHFTNSRVKAEEASKRGAIGTIGLYTPEMEKSYPWERMIANPSYKLMTWVGPDGRANTAGPNLQGTATIHPGKSQLLFEGAEKSYAALTADDAKVSSFPLKSRVSFAGAMAVEDVSSPNVVGLIPGSDPALKNEYVVLSGHLDHTGVNERLIAEGKDGINNGAMDNAVGIATMLEVARRFMAEERPARSVLIVAVTAEEKGLIGSDYFAHFPTIGDGVMVADVNLDMPVMLHDFTDVVAFGAERSTIGDILKKALDQTGVALQPDPIPELGIFTRSDHYRFVEQGVPSIFLWTGFSNGGEEAFWDFYKNHYHRPSDDMSQPIRFGDLARFADLNYIIARAISDSPERPRWKEGDFFGDLFSKQ